MWLGYSEGAMTNDVSRTWGVLISVRVRAIHRLQSTELLTNLILHLETMQWTHPEMQGDLPPPCRAHSATLVGRKIVVIGGGENASYYNRVHVFDIPGRWSRPTFTTADVSPPRRAHTTVLYENKIWVFGG
jgi:hypothetical protein